METLESTISPIATDTATPNENYEIIEEQRNQLPRFVPSAEDPILTDLWIGIILILMVFVCVGYICTCILYHKFKRWKRDVLQAQHAAMNIHPSFCEEYTYEESLPSYTIVTGLPSYDQAMEQFLQLRAIRRVSSPKVAAISDDQNIAPRITFASGDEDRKQRRFVTLNSERERQMNLNPFATIPTPNQPKIVDE